MTTDPDPDPAVVANLERQFRRQAQRIADRLRESADTIESRGKADIPRNLWDMLPDYLRVARDISHELRFMMANVPDDRLLESGMEAHIYVRTGSMER